MSSPRSLILLAGLALVAPVGSAGAQTPAAQSLAPAVTVATALERELVERVIVTGTLMPREEILVAPEVEGLRIVEVRAEEGDRVEAGQVLARLNRDLLETTLAQNNATITRAAAAIAQAKSQIVQAQAADVEARQALERTESLSRSGNTTQAALEQRVSAARAAEGRLAAARDALAIAEADRAAAEAQRKEIEVRLARTEIKAPAAGIVSRKNARVGATASGAGDPLFRIIKDGEIELEGEMTETQLPRIKEGAAAEVRIDEDRTVAGRVRNVYPEVDRATRLGRVRISLARDPSLRVGSFARGTVEVARRAGVAVPLGAVLYGAEGPSVQVVVNDRVETRRVRTGLSSDGLIEIREGVAAGEPVVARAGSFLRHGDTVRPIVAETAQGGSARR
ncbi:efflux RND transporter periplasmic adaptor subunit [Salinarimonas soli]|uniref:Efflux RND transporter periplasmic adaptor subunit n=1 Tax=Salinarimonas soli TaxID=1638099 RepID=A0A5B2VBM7_9HYPH|nr:efflux RND transporter periplasmic adaptor subunit [Salinarimonas soli]KAA2236501.1 efflux RND transporter periplasmic adaptor subunit [Salinarimonas soli]